MRLLSYFTVLFLFTLSCTQQQEEPTPAPNPPPATGSGSITVIQDEVNETPVVLAGSQHHGFVVSFERKTEDGTLLEFTAQQDELPVIMTDNEGNEWDLFGQAVKGPRQGQQLNPAKSYMGYWLVFGSMYPGVEIYDGPPANDPPDPTPKDDNWLIPTDFIFRGSGFDAIKSLEDPAFVNYDFKSDVERNFYVKDDDFVVGVKIEGEVRAYPHSVLDWHEVINDQVEHTPFAVVYCPLTGTASVWDRVVDGQETSFGVSGLLYNSNVLPFDRATNSIWTQLDARCVNGALMGQPAGRFPFVEMRWSAWRQIFRLPKVLAPEQGAEGFDYTEYPYGDYRTNHDYLAYPIAYDDDRLPRKERVHGVIVEGKAKVYTLDNFR